MEAVASPSLSSTSGLGTADRASPIRLGDSSHAMVVRDDLVSTPPAAVASGGRSLRRHVASLRLRQSVLIRDRRRAGARRHRRCLSRVLERAGEARPPPAGLPVVVRQYRESLRSTSCPAPRRRRARAGGSARALAGPC